MASRGAKLGLSLSLDGGESKLGDDHHDDDDSDIDDDEEEELKSYDLDGNYFVKSNIAVNRTGVAMKGNPKAFTVVPEALELGELIGRGSSSYVQRALHRPSGIMLALKVINIFDRAKRRQLIREIKTLYDADCDCLVGFFGAYHREGAITIALEYMNGGALSNVIRQMGAIPEAALASIMFQVLWGMAYLKHDRRIHRDIKPSNILVNSLGQVKLSDFGVSAELKNSIGMAATFTGTFKYMAPERIQHEPYSFSSDMWSVGIVALECATGEYPYKEAETYIEMCETIVEMVEPRPPPGKFSPEFDQFVSQMVKKKPEDRLPPDIMLGSPWLQKHGARDLPSAVAIVKAWIDSCAARSGEPKAVGGGGAGGAGPDEGAGAGAAAESAGAGAGAGTGVDYGGTAGAGAGFVAGTGAGAGVADAREFASAGFRGGDMSM